MYSLLYGASVTVMLDPNWQLHRRYHHKYICNVIADVIMREKTQWLKIQQRHDI